jgi:hypothetical protein
MKKLVLTSLFLSISVSTLAYADSNKNNICPSDLKYKSINLKEYPYKP